MGRKYQTQDFEVVDYELWKLDGAPDLLRGPRPATLFEDDPRFICFLGAAQTFGTLCRYPFPNLVASMTGYEVLNLGLGGAGPTKYLMNSNLFEHINKSKAAIVQVMAARSAPNSRMVNPPGGSMFRWRGESDNVPLRHSEILYKELLETESESVIEEIISETRANWIEEYKKLRERIKVPAILLYISNRQPEYKMATDTISGLFGGFPQLVNQECLDEVGIYFDSIVVSVSNEGVPSPLTSRFTGRPTKVQRDRHLMQKNNYYPNQYQHLDAAHKLARILGDYI